MVVAQRNVTMRERKAKEISHWLIRSCTRFRRSEAGERAVPNFEPEPDGCNWSRDLVINYGRDRLRECAASTCGRCTRMRGAAST